MHATRGCTEEPLGPSAMLDETCTLPGSNPSLHHNEGTSHFAPKVLQQLKACVRMSLQSVTMVQHQQPLAVSLDHCVFSNVQHLPQAADCAAAAHAAVCICELCQGCHGLAAAQAGLQISACCRAALYLHPAWPCTQVSKPTDESPPETPGKVMSHVGLVADCQLGYQNSCRESFMRTRLLLGQAVSGADVPVAQDMLHSSGASNGAG